MKIINITKKFEANNYGGIERVINDICNHFYKNKKIISHVYTLKNKKVKKRNYKILSDQKHFEINSCPVSFNSFKTINRIKNEYDIINFHFPWPFMDLLSLFVPKDKILVTYHADITERNLLYYFYLPLMFIFLYRARKIIVTSDDYLNSSKILKYFRKKILIVPIGIQKFKKKLSINKKIKFKDYYIFIGNLRPYKGINNLIKAFKNLKQNLVILGNGKELRDLEQQIHKVKNILLIKNPKEEDKISLLRRSKALILTSIDRREAFGIVLVEGLSEKKPLISTKIQSGTSFVNKDKVTGIEIEPFNVNQIITSVKKIDNNSKLRKFFEKNSYNRYLKHFTLNKMINSYAKIFLTFKN